MYEGFAGLGFLVGPLFGAFIYTIDFCWVYWTVAIWDFLLIPWVWVVMQRFDSALKAMEALEKAQEELDNSLQEVRLQ
jgi:MFS family permease